MKEIIVERYGIKIIITYDANLSSEKIEELKRDAMTSCIRIRNKRDE